MSYLARMFSQILNLYQNKVKPCLLIIRTGLLATTVLLTALVGGQLQAVAGFVVNNGAPQTGVVVGPGSGNDTVTASGAFTGSFSQNLGNIYGFENINILSNANLSSPNSQPFITNNIYTFTGTNGLTYTNIWYHQPIISFIHGSFTNNGVINYSNNVLPSSTALDVYDIFPAGSAPNPNTNRYVYHGEGVYVNIGNVQYGGPATIVNGSPSNTNGVINSVITGSGQEIAEAIHAEAFYNNNARTPDITFLNYGSVLGCSSNCINGSAAGYNGYTLDGGQTVYNGPFAKATALAPYDTTALYASTYYGDVNLTQAGTVTAISTGGRAGNTAGLATAVGVDIYTYNGQINLTNSGIITAIATATNTANANAVFAWSENADTNVTGGFTFVNTGTIIAISTNSPNAGCSALYGGCDGGIVNLINTGTVIGNTTGGGWGWGTENDRAENIYIYNSGKISHNTGLGVFVYGQPGGNAFITNTATGSIYGGNEGIATENFSGNVTIYNYGSVMGGSPNNNAMDLGSGNDTVHLYGLPNIVGWMNGQGGTNVLDFELTGVLQLVNGSPATLGNNLSAYSLGTSGNITVSGQTYKWSNFNVTGTITSTGGVGPVYKAATNTDLTSGVSWTGGIPPIAGSIACWTNTSLGAGLTMNSAISWGGISVVGAASDIAISGSGPLTLGTNGLDMSVSPVNLSISVPVLLGSNQTWNVNGGKSLNMSGVVSGNYGLLKAGSGTLVLTNANTYSGGTTVSNGTLALDYNPNDGPTGTLAGGSTITINASGTLRLDVEDVLGYYGGIPSALSINGGLVTSANVANTTPVQNGGTSFRVTLPTLTFTGGTLSSGTNNHGDTYGGSYLVGGTNYTLASSSTAVINAYTVSIQNNTTFNVASGTTPSGVDLDVSSILQNWVSGPQGLTKARFGVMKLDGVNTYSGPTTINAGRLALAGSGSIASTPSITLAGGATFDVSGLSSPFVLGSSQTLSNSTATAVFVGNGSTAAGTLSLNYTNGLPALTVSNGTLTLASGTIFKINNLGSQLAVGSYKLISKSGGGAVGGAVTTNTVAVGGGGVAAPATLAMANGELNLVVGNPVNTTPTNITVTASSNTLNLSWPQDHTGWTLQSNAISLANPSNWFAVPGSTTTNKLSITINPSQTNVFYRMKYP